MIPKFRVWDKENKIMWNIERWHIEDENFDLHIRMKSGREYLFEVSGTELDRLFDGLFEREKSGSFQNFGTDEVINISEIEYLKYEKVKNEV